MLQKIREGRISMRSRAYFLARLILTSVLVVVTLLLSLFVVSFIVFSVQESGEQFLLGFGQKGLQTFLILFPWFTSSVAIFLLIILEWLVHSFKFGYRIPMLRIFFGIVIVAVVGSALVSLTPLHSTLLEKADNNQLPLIGAVYEEIHDSRAPKGFFRGEVRSVATSSFVITHNDRDRDADDGSWVVVPPPEFDMKTITVGKKVYVAGETEKETVSAYGIHEFEDEE